MPRYRVLYKTTAFYVGYIEADSEDDARADFYEHGLETEEMAGDCEGDEIVTIEEWS